MSDLWRVIAELTTMRTVVNIKSYPTENIFMTIYFIDEGKRFEYDCGSFEELEGQLYADFEHLFTQNKKTRKTKTIDTSDDFRSIPIM